ncbi:hypothetical protein ABWJ92_22925 [Streptomyces sp. NPDC000609]|uniref:hypothetical protein n=1 Tax=Streptomyces sp. NPDC000609 TaxID=3160957 RepID=UPI00339B0C42
MNDRRQQLDGLRGPADSAGGKNDLIDRVDGVHGVHGVEKFNGKIRGKGSTSRCAPRGRAVSPEARQRSSGREFGTRA